jgi:hypothetical protein
MPPASAFGCVLSDCARIEPRKQRSRGVTIPLRLLSAVISNWVWPCSGASACVYKRRQHRGPSPRSQSRSLRGSTSPASGSRRTTLVPRIRSSPSVTACAAAPGSRSHCLTPANLVSKIILRKPSYCHCHTNKHQQVEQQQTKYEKLIDRFVRMHIMTVYCADCFLSHPRSYGLVLRD